MFSQSDDYFIDFSTERLVVILVGLPARGKSYISQKLVRYLNWNGLNCKVRFAATGVVFVFVSSCVFVVCTTTLFLQYRVFYRFLINIECRYLMSVITDAPNSGLDRTIAFSTLLPKAASRFETRCVAPSLRMSYVVRGVNEA